MQADQELVALQISEHIRAASNDCVRIFTNGGCWRFAMALQAAIPSGEIVYDPIDGHAALMIGKKVFDINGEAERPSRFIPIVSYQALPLGSDPSSWKAG